MVSGVARSPSSDSAGPAGRALIHKKTRIESPRRIGTSRISRRTTKRSTLQAARRLSARSLSLLASPADRDGVEELVRRRARHEALDVLPEGQRGLRVRVRNRRQRFHDVLVRLLVQVDPGLPVGLDLGVVEHLEQLGITEAELWVEVLEERPDEVVRVGEVTRPPNQVQVAGVALIDSAEVVRIPRSRLGDDPEAGLVQAGRHRLEVVLRVRHVRPGDVARVPELDLERLLYPRFLQELL